MCEKMNSNFTFPNILKPVFHLANLFTRTEEKSNSIGWRPTLTTSPANHIRFLLVRANKFASGKPNITKYPVSNCSNTGGNTYFKATLISRFHLIVKLPEKSPIKIAVCTFDYTSCEKKRLAICTNSVIYTVC